MMNIPTINTNMIYYSFEDFSRMNNITEKLINHLGLNDFDYDEEKIQQVLDFIFGKNVYITYCSDNNIELILTGHADPSKRYEDLVKVFHTQFVKKMNTLGGKYSLTEDDEADVYYDIHDDGVATPHRLRSIEVKGGNILFHYIMEDNYYDDEYWSGGEGDYTMVAKYTSVDRLNRIWKMLKNK